LEIFILTTKVTKGNKRIGVLDGEIKKSLPVS